MLTSNMDIAGGIIFIVMGFLSSKNHKKIGQWTADMFGYKPKSYQVGFLLWGIGAVIFGLILVIKLLIKTDL